MIETIMLLSIGFLAAALLGLALAPLVHHRAVRLTTRRLDSCIPASVVELRVDKDHLRAEFAMSIRRLEVTVEEMREKSAKSPAELVKNSERINRLQADCSDKNAAIRSLEEQNKTIHNKLHVVERKFELESGLLLTAQRALCEKEVEFGVVSERNAKLERLGKMFNASDAMIQDLHTQLAEAQNRERSVADLHREIDRLEAHMDAIVASRSSSVEYH
jgi:chromosome segregation ATPase